MPPPLDLVFSVSIEPFAILAGFGIAAVCLCLFQGQTPLDDPIPLVKGGMIGADDAIGCHDRGWW